MFVKKRQRTFGPDVPFRLGQKVQNPNLFFPEHQVIFSLVPERTWMRIYETHESRRSSPVPHQKHGSGPLGKPHSAKSCNLIWIN